MRAMRTWAATVAFSLDADTAASTRAGGLPHSLAVLADTAGSTIRSVSLIGGTDGSTLTNGDYIDAIEFSEQFSDVSWVHFIGADTPDLWTAIVTSCQYMIDNMYSVDFEKPTSIEELQKN